MSNLIDIDGKVSQLYDKVSQLIERARQHVSTTVNTTEVYTKYYVGQYIVEEEQQGERRAQYGQQVLQSLSKRLTERFGKGWSVENLKLCRRFYLVYSNSVTSGYPISTQKENQWLPHQTAISPIFSLSWSHYLILMRVEDPNARSFYEIECAQQQWSKRQLSRQVGSSLYERLALSRDKEAVMRLAREGQTVEKPEDIIKNVLDVISAYFEKGGISFSKTEITKSTTK